jgi:hypothetical protein
MAGRGVSPGVIEGIRFQLGAFGLRSLSSPLYAALLEAALDDIDRGGPVASVLGEVPSDLDPISDAVVLRFLGAVHRLVLTGEAPDLARWFATAGGRFDPASSADVAGAQAAFVAACDDHRDTLVGGLDVTVQTNEVGRCATLAVGFTDVLRGGLPLRLLELGASAGLNLRWDRWRYESGPTSWGDPDAAITFRSNYREPYPDLSAAILPGDAVVERLGCDRSPIDPTTAEGRLLLRSFVWPDQADRHARLDAALVAAAAAPVSIDAADAASWLPDRLAAPAHGRATVVYHSIIWQYLPTATRAAIVDALEVAGVVATDEAPLHWLRMEPGDDPSEAAEVRLRSWPSGDDRLLAHTGYHGHPVWAEV